MLSDHGKMRAGDPDKLHTGSERKLQSGEHTGSRVKRDMLLFFFFFFGYS